MDLALGACRLQLLFWQPWQPLLFNTRRSPLVGGLDWWLGNSNPWVVLEGKGGTTHSARAQVLYVGGQLVLIAEC